jgi:energy-converting hydrogenase Eha subunit G
MIKDPHTRRHYSLALLATGAVLFLLAPENAAISLVFAGLGVFLEVLGVKLGHSGPK